MIIFLLLIPALAAVSAMFLYPYSGKKDFLKFDVVQFFYVFVLAPFLFIWLKTLLFFLLRSELGINLTGGQVILVDTIVSVLFLYIFAFIVIHGLTKTFSLKITKDPLHDLFDHSEYFHLDLSHIVMNLGAMAILTVLSIINVFVPIAIEAPRMFFYFVIAGGIISAIVMFIGLWLYDSPQPHYMRITKLGFGSSFLVHIFMYYIYDVRFSLEYGMFWFIGILFTVVVILGLFAEKKESVPQPTWFRVLPFHINLKKSKYYLLSVKRIQRKFFTIFNRG